MKKKFKVVFDIVQLSDATFDEVIEKLKKNHYRIVQQFTSRQNCCIEAYDDSGACCFNRGDMVFTDEFGELFVMSEKRFNSMYEEVEEDSL